MICVCLDQPVYVNVSSSSTIAPNHLNQGVLELKTCIEGNLGQCILTFTAILK